jgi:hypothetical protein
MVGKLVPCWEDSWLCGGGGVGYLALFLVELFGWLLQNMLFVGVSKGK